ncbi:hypothetical protein ABTX81_33475 [Kitasatospora sp. NPDC097605]|uniref:hypothetical protein n=1 Tax=Kitasatospora sp. NPDC097605 TaxID=3157226 RepID=UPI00331A70E5
MGIKKRFGKAVASSAVVAATLVGTVAGTAGTAQAAQVDTLVNYMCNKPATTAEPWIGWPGAKFLCGGGYGFNIPLYNFDDGTRQSFFVGADHAIWTTWMPPTGGASPVVSLGGVVTSDATISAHDGNYLQLKVRGTDGKSWYKERDKGGNWSNWHR